MSLHSKLLAIQEAGVRVDKDGKNPHFKSAYVTLDNLLQVVLPLASKEKLVVTHYVSERHLITAVTDTESKEALQSSFPIYAEDPQKVGATITYAKRYNIGAIFNLITELDDDGTIESQGYKNMDQVTDYKPYIGPFEVEKIKVAIEKNPALFLNADDAVRTAQLKYKIDDKMEKNIRNLFI